MRIHGIRLISGVFFIWESDPGKGADGESLTAKSARYSAAADDTKHTHIPAAYEDLREGRLDAGRRLSSH